ncbi:VWA domain-containing protein [Sulfitobacter pseudonitzschiae]|uniref:vWA domain-containing protein n=1 Tax=Pseudosulfitobacter pseudonitzschiae TaxID=1402135 RepID=UPI001AF8310F|nr:VWA domain-containing protein [Pseudosulfitobacter pseudonitzschiae]MBM1818091.1 VWA domain-containing protein [Pseudosulfitobacter pseudonitzschiae]MBM1839974.1 VWA domain-containing protein [Pseudosulfitobacter pseudonitzschiae]MBM1844836.1 VWA domain-containing protein [Pseudosulfitobacter pseudonitzschiae]MBM1854516.1 VWA domain-containing protein [Pseudosulfitobacter pseudonitzschiae]MBM1859383.1 VWA domain-containing protein [Pseudosulfitobacter pseudonitzschiae]
MRSLVTAGLIALTSALAPAALAQERPSTILVLDASGSMWGQIDGINKITIARDVVGDIVSDFPADQNLGFVTYGHRERGQCADIETLVEPAPGTAAEIAGIVEGLNPRGMTPMTDAVVTAAQALRHTEQAATVILVSDGIETCNPDPCAAARALEEAGVDFTAHVIGFDVRGEADALLQMQCIAEETGGRFLTADNAQELNEALREVTAAPASGSFTFTANLGGEEIGDETVWERPAAPLELPLLSGEVIWEISDTSFNMVQTGTANPFTTDLPFGEYIVTVHSTAQDDFSQTEASLALDSARNVHAIFPPITSQPPAAQVFGPAQTLVGSAFTVSWEGEGLAPRDYVTIVPADAEDGAYADYDRLENRTEGELRAPAEPGLYEVRLQLDAGDRVLARTPVEVVDAEVAVSAPAQVVVGSAFPVTWQGEGLHPRDYVTIVPAGSADGTYADYDRMQGRSEGELRAPAEPGLYEVRLQLDVGDRVLARTPVEVVDAEVAVSAPAQVVVGSAFPVTWQGEGLHPRDYVTIVPAGSADGTYADYDRMQGRREGELRAPAEPGLYEVRLQLDAGDRVLARTPVEVMDGNVSLDGPDRARAGAEITLSWTGAIHPRDYIAIVPRGTPDGEQSGYRRIQDEDQATFTAPAEPGAYEIRYHLDRGDRVMARRPLEVLAADAPIDEGAGLMVPGTARPGDIVTVSWTIEAGDADRRVALARADAPDFTWITVHHVGDETETVIKLPDEPGQYEVRFLDLQSQSVLGRAMITLDE